MTSEALVGGVPSVIVNKSVLNNTVFPIDLAPVKSVLLGQVTMAVGLALVVLALLFLGKITFAILFLPVIWALHVMMLVGILWILSLVNIVFRDLQNLIGAVVIFMMIASPIAYTPEMVPSSLKLLLVLNPLAYFIVAYQDVLIFGRVPPLSLMATMLAMAALLFTAGGVLFAKGKQALIDYV